MDFTPATCTQLLEALQAKGYVFQTVANFVRSPEEKDIIILRHDVDRLPANALQMGRLEHKLDISATYYFRAVPDSWDKSLRDG
jgi:hypothetical protein